MSTLDSSERPKASPLGDQLFLMGEIFYLLTHSPLHRSYSIADVMLNFMAPIKLGLFRVYRSKTRPVGFVAWGYLDDSVAQRHMRGEPLLKVEDWQSGSALWVVEFVAPFGHTASITGDLRRNIFAENHVRSFRRHKDGTAGIVEWYGDHWARGKTGAALAGG